MGLSVTLIQKILDELNYWVSVPRSCLFNESRHKEPVILILIGATLHLLH